MSTVIRAGNIPYERLLVTGSRFGKAQRARRSRASGTSSKQRKLDVPVSSRPISARFYLICAMRLLWVTSGRSSTQFHNPQAECRLFSKAVVQNARNCGKLGSAFGQERTV